MKSKITILFFPNKITMMYTMYPFWVTRFTKEFTITTDLDWALKKDTNSILILVGWITKKNKHGNKKTLQELRHKYKTLVYFDDNDGSESHYLDLLQFFDLYYKKQVFADPKNYLKNFYGNRVYTDYYHKTMGVNEEKPPAELPKPIDASELNKIRVAWNLAIGQYPQSKLKVRICQRVFPLMGTLGMWFLQGNYPMEKDVPKPCLAKCQARFDFKGYRETVGFQRKLFMEILKDEPNFLKGTIPLKEYNREIQKIQAILSPYGWGEVCFRDFEAIINGAILVKPKMDHIRTWPDLYQEEKSYVSVLWDGSDMLNKVDELLQDPQRMEFIRNYAWQELKKAYSQTDLKVEEMISEIRALR